MLVSGLRRLVAIVALLLIFTLLVVRFHGEVLTALPSHKVHETEDALSMKTKDKPSKPWQGWLSAEKSLADDLVVAQTHHEVFSISSTDKEYFLITFGEYEARNPSIVPHPTMNDTWFVIAQQRTTSDGGTGWFAELVCNAVFTNGVLGCVHSPLILPIPTIFGKQCVDDLAHFNLNIGPHDARVFFGPNMPYTVYGSNSLHTCFGQWILDFDILVDWEYGERALPEFRAATELQRPAEYRPIEKNWFAFWDKSGQMYIHYDAAPKRAFAQLNYDGSVGPDLAPLAAASDEKCMARFWPKVGPELESIHQATNSLSITMCERADRSCAPDDLNTYVMTIIQHKSFWGFHSVYEPYIVLFQQRAPFEIFAISSKPFWIHGRGKAGQGKMPDGISAEQSRSWNQTEMFYITSMSWKAHGQKYHGYRDDVLFVAFGIEDSTSAAIDVVASDLLQDLHFCSTA